MKIQGYPAIDEVLIWPENGKPYYVQLDEWNKARFAYGNGTATQEQLDLL